MKKGRDFFPLGSGKWLLPARDVTVALIVAEHLVKRFKKAALSRKNVLTKRCLAFACHAILERKTAAFPSLKLGTICGPKEA